MSRIVQCGGCGLRINVDPSAENSSIHCPNADCGRRVELPPVIGAKNGHQTQATEFRFLEQEQKTKAVEFKCAKCGEPVRTGMVRCRNCHHTLQAPVSNAKQTIPAIGSQSMAVSVSEALDDEHDLNDEDEQSESDATRDVETVMWTPDLDAEDESTAPAADITGPPEAEIQQKPVQSSRPQRQDRLPRWAQESLNLLRENRALQIAFGLLLLLMVFSIGRISISSVESTSDRESVPKVAAAAPREEFASVASPAAVVEESTVQLPDQPANNPAEAPAVDVGKPVAGAIPADQPKLEMPVAAEAPAAQAKPLAAAQPGAIPPKPAGVIAQVEPSVVVIETGVSGKVTGQGSGFLFVDRETVVTNFHVVEDALEARCLFRDGTTIMVKGFVAARPDLDLAVLRLEKPANVDPLKIALPHPVQGSAVTAFGTPQGLTWTISNGIVSAVRRKEELQENDLLKSVASGYAAGSVWIQTTSPVSPGNNGGPLIDPQGRVVGVSTWSLKNGQNLNFAVAAEHVDEVWKQVAKMVQPLAALPVKSKPVTATLSDKQKLIALLRVQNRALVEIFEERKRLLTEREDINAKQETLKRAILVKQTAIISANEKATLAKRNMAEQEQIAATIRPMLAVAATLLERQFIQDRLDLTTIIYRRNEKELAAYVGEANAQMAELTGLGSELKKVNDKEAELFRRANVLRDKWLAVADPFGSLKVGDLDTTEAIIAEWLALDSENPYAYVWSAVFQIHGRGNLQAALQEIDRAKSLKNDLAPALAVEAYVRHRLGEKNKAATLFEKARLKKDMRWFVLRFQALFNYETGNYLKARADYRSAVSDAPEETVLRIELAELLAGCPDVEIRNGDEAIQHASKACDLSSSKRWDALLALASAQAESGDFANAIKSAETAFSLAPTPDFQKECRNRLTLFHQNQPWRKLP